MEETETPIYLHWTDHDYITVMKFKHISLQQTKMINRP